MYGNANIVINNANYRSAKVLAIRRASSGDIKLEEAGIMRRSRFQHRVRPPSAAHITIGSLGYHQWLPEGDRHRWPNDIPTLRRVPRSCHHRASPTNHRQMPRDHIHCSRIQPASSARVDKALFNIGMINNCSTAACTQVGS